MTLAVAIKANEAIIVAADSRGTIGDPRGLTAVNDTQQKIFQFGSCALAISGAAEMAQTLMDELAKRGLNNPPNILMRRWLVLGKLLKYMMDGSERSLSSIARQLPYC
jgi:ATP-dependent protease HslVU (ClpYQ) peptidase subunit